MLSPERQIEPQSVYSGTVRLCPICDHSLSGIHQVYRSPNWDASALEILQQTAFCANAVLDQMGAFDVDGFRPK